MPKLQYVMKKKYILRIEMLLKRMQDDNVDGIFLF